VQSAIYSSETVLAPAVSSRVVFKFVYFGSQLRLFPDPCRIRAPATLNGIVGLDQFGTFSATC